MEEFDQIASRWQFDLPEDYRNFWQSGLLRNDPAVGLWLSRFKWLSLRQIVEYNLPSWVLDTIVPFAITTGGDHYCWHIGGRKPPWVADCPRDSAYGEGYAPSFSGFVYRALLQEFNSTWLIDQLSLSPGDVKNLLLCYTDRVSQFLPEAWMATLRDIVSRKLLPKRPGIFSLITLTEVQALVQRDLMFPMLNKSFRQTWE